MELHDRDTVSLMFGLLLVLVAVFLAIEMKSLLLGEGASPEALARIERALVDGTGGGSASITRIIHMRTLHLGPEELLVAAKIGVPADVSGADIARVINEAEARIRAVEPIARVIYLEPDLSR